MYTNTANRHFVIRRSQDRLLVSACSGHGFKFAPVIGEALAALVTEGRTHHQLRLFGAVGF